MSEIKMSDVFELPVPHMYIIDYKNQAQQTISASIAINAYDDNQQEIALQNAQLLDAESQISDQKRQIDDKVKLIKFTDKANSEMSSEIAQLKAELKLAKENHALSSARCSREMLVFAGLHNGLAAHVNALKNGLEFMMQRPLDESGYVSMVDQCNELLDKTPQQCLASVKAKAINDSMPELHSQGLGCGLEDRDITDRYEAAEYGFNECLEQIAFNSMQLSEAANGK